MNPLVRIEQARQDSRIPPDAYKLIVDRAHIMYSGIDRIERASGISFPVSYVEPSILVTPPDAGSFQFGVLYARTIPLILDEKLQVVIQVCAPLVSYGLRGTIHAVLAHEFLHYLELLSRISKMRLLSDEITGNVFESVYADETRLFEPGAVFTDRTLLRHITKKFPSGFRDYRLEDKVMEHWIERGLPQSGIALDRNFARISVKTLSAVSLDPKFLARLNEIERKSEAVRKRMHY